MNRKLVRMAHNNYIYRENGVVLAKGPLSWVKTIMTSLGLHDIDLAVQVMKDNSHSVADFGLNGHFVLSQKFMDTNFKELQ